MNKQLVFTIISSDFDWIKLELNTKNERRRYSIGPARRESGF